MLTAQLYPDPRSREKLGSALPFGWSEFYASCRGCRGAGRWSNNEQAPIASGQRYDSVHKGKGENLWLLSRP